MDKVWFEEPRTPINVFERARALGDQIGAKRFFREPGLSWLREAWTIGRFGMICEADAVLLSTKDPPDAHLWKSQRKFSVEITEALRPGRRRAEEFKTPRSGVVDIPQEDLPTSAEELDHWLVTAIEHKIPRLKEGVEIDLLFVHLSAWSFFVKEREVELMMRDVVHRYRREKNLDVCILYNNRAAGLEAIVPGGFKNGLRD